MPQPLYIVDAFTHQPFAGNPAAVCLLDKPRESDWMQKVAAEMNLSETAFLQPDKAGVWGLRWFTPKAEVKLCGHATLASAHVLWQRGETEDVLTFHTHSGILTAVREGEAIRLDFPALPATVTEPPAGLHEALGVEALHVGRSRDDLLVVLESAQAVAELNPDLELLADIAVRGVIATAASDRRDVDIVSRFFAPRVGVPEDPVTGSAHCCLAPYWAERLGRPELRAFQASARGGELTVRIQDERVHLVGTAITTLEGKLHV